MDRHFEIREFLACLLMITLVVSFSYGVFIANAQSTVVFLDPPSQTVGSVGDSFMVNVSVSGASNLYGYEFQLFYNSTGINGTLPVQEGPFLKSGGQTYFSTTNFTDNYNSTSGIVWVDSTLVGAPTGVSGSGVLVTINFKSIALSSAIPLYLADVKLVDHNAQPIPSQFTDGTVTIVPEFASLFATSVLIIISLFTVLLAKRAKSKTSIRTVSVSEIHR